jgi:purine/pyrimidine-nucleoside phosphorylase
MDYRSPENFPDVTVTCKANVYFDGRVVSHAITFADGSRKTLGLIYPGGYKFNTGVAERMEIVAGACRARVAGREDWIGFPAGTWFDVPANSYFEIEVGEGIAEYVCSFL